MLKYGLVAALGLLASGCTDSVKRDFGPADPCARASTVFTLAGGGPGLRASLSSTTGPAGLTATMQGTTTVVTTTYTTGPLLYDGTLTGRNEFGQCEYKLTGTYPLSNTWYDDWKRHGFVNITPPILSGVSARTA